MSPPPTAPTYKYIDVPVEDLLYDYTNRVEEAAFASLSSPPTVRAATSEEANPAPTTSTTTGATSKVSISDLESALRVSHARGAGGKIDGSVIELLAARLGDIGRGMIKSSREDADAHPDTLKLKGQYILEISAALIDEVLRGAGRISISAGGGSYTKEVVLQGDWEAGRKGWGEEREKRVWDLEGVVDILKGRVESLEEEVKGLKERGVGGDDLSDWNEGQEDDDEEELDTEEEDAGTQTKAEKDKLDAVVATVDKLNLGVETLEQDVRQLKH
ncbi:hypothetical protein IAT38_004837 [Cryptococcus sp. DSM 104549]